MEPVVDAPLGEISGTFRIRRKDGTVVEGRYSGPAHLSPEEVKEAYPGLEVVKKGEADDR